VGPTRSCIQRVSGVNCRLVKMTTHTYLVRNIKLSMAVPPLRHLILDVHREKLQLYISLYLVSSVAVEFGSDLIPLWILFNGQFGV